MPTRRHNHILENPVAAYDAIAPYYRTLSEERKAFLGSVDRIVALNANGRHAMLDIGTADGTRAINIARAAMIPLVVAVEPSRQMQARCPKDLLVWGCSAADIPHTPLRFDVVTLLWNVLGHLSRPDERASVLARARSLLTPTGVILADFANRYNAAHYGWCATIWRALCDSLVWSDTSGDVVVQWDQPEMSIRTHGHVFTQRELRALFESSGLAIRNRWVLNYRTGKPSRFSFCGHLMYCLVPQ